MVIGIVGFGGDVGHAGVGVGGADGVAHGLVLLDDGEVALVVFDAARGGESRRNLASAI